MSSRPSASANNASRSPFATFATLLHDNVVRPFSIDVDSSPLTAQAPDSSPEPPLNSARSLSIDVPFEGFGYVPPSARVNFG